MEATAKSSYFERSICCVVLCLFTSCSGMQESERYQLRRANETRVQISNVEYRPCSNKVNCKQDYNVDALTYPWEISLPCGIESITINDFRCKGSVSHKKKASKGRSTSVYIMDCNSESHSLPLRGGKEYVFPVLIDMCNYVQQELKSCVKIAAGHRCDAHSRYQLASLRNVGSRHRACALVTLYVENCSDTPEKVVDSIASFLASDCYKRDNIFKTSCKYIHQGTKNARLTSKEFDVGIASQEALQDSEHLSAPYYITIKVLYDYEAKSSVNIYSSFEDGLKIR